MAGSLQQQNYFFFIIPFAINDNHHDAMVDNQLIIQENKQ
jgi:hypothetical protein